jgi:hypothetical protein
MKNLARIFLLCLCGSAFAQVNYTSSSCLGNDYSRWTNCLGTAIYPNGIQYIGEFRNGTRDGLGVEYSKDGKVIKSGIWRGNDLFAAYALDRNRYKFRTIESYFPPSEDQNKNSDVAENNWLSAEIEADKLRLQKLDTPFSAQQQENQNSANPAPLIGNRLALVIGNASYITRPLRNSTNDADDFSDALKSSGFKVIDLRDATLQQMRAGVRQFGDRLINNDVGLVYYSGHGVEVKGRNYFIPVNADIQREDEIADQGLDVSLVLEKMSTAGKGVNILIVDACRDDPFGRSFRSSSRGLANLDAPRGTIIAYATSPGKVASDGDGRNSPYTKNLVRAMQQPNKPIEQVFKEVRRAVQEETKNQQTPWENTSLSGDFYFKVQR